MQKTVLIVDDSRVARMALKKLLLPHQFDIVELASAEEALAHLQSNSAKPALIFMDVMMEGMDGLAATRQIKAMDDMATIPIIICTGNSTEVDQQNALATGAIAVLNKPPKEQAVTKILATLATETVAKQSPAPDKAAMTEKVVAILEQKLVPKLEHDLRIMSQDLSNKIVGEIVENQLPKQIQLVIDTKMPELSQQLRESIKQETGQTIQPLLQKTMTQTLAEQLPEAVQGAVSELALDQQIAEGITEQAKPWLAEQEQQLQQRLNEQTQQYIESSIDQHLNNSLAAMIAPLVTLQVNEQLDQQVDVQLDEQVESLANRVSQLNQTVIALGIVVFVLAVILIL